MGGSKVKNNDELSEETMQFLRTQAVSPKNWVGMSLDELEELISIGDTFSFSYNDKDYIIEGICFDVEAKGRVGCYVIGDESTEYPESRQARTPDELKALPFLEGKSIIEEFDELKFFD